MDDPRSICPKCGSKEWTCDDGYQDDEEIYYDIFVCDDCGTRWDVES